MQKPQQLSLLNSALSLPDHNFAAYAPHSPIVCHYPQACKRTYAPHHAPFIHSLPPLLSAPHSAGSIYFHAFSFSSLPTSPSMFSPFSISNLPFCHRQYILPLFCCHHLTFPLANSILPSLLLSAPTLLPEYSSTPCTATPLTSPLSNSARSALLYFPNHLPHPAPCHRQNILPQFHPSLQSFVNSLTPANKKAD